MTWFRYLKSSEVVNENVKNLNYSYAYAKRRLPRFTPLDDIQEGTWLSVSVDGLNIGKYVDTNLNPVVDESSYIVVYEDEDFVGDFTPVKCLVHEDILYFKAADFHAANIEIYKTYAIYYHTNNIHYVKSVANGPFTFDDPYDYQIDTSSLIYVGSISEIEGLTHTVTFDSASRYNFSFVNSQSDWNNGEAKNPGAKMYLSFSGPNLILYGAKGPDFGKVKLNITGLSNAATPTSNIEESNVIIDCYSPAYQDNVVIFSRDEASLSFRDYVIDLQVLGEKNPSSRGNRFKVNSYRYNYNIYVDFLPEQLSDKLALASSGMFRGVASSGDQA